MVLNLRKSSLLGSLVAYLAFQNTVSAFSVNSSLQRSVPSTTTLEAEKGSRRRDFFGSVRGIFLGAAAVGTLSQSAAPALAETTGRIVEMQVANIDGEEGKVGTIRIQLRPEWAPRGVQRFEDLTEQGFFDGCRMFRVLPGFIAQFGITGDPTVQSKWRSSSIPDDPVKVSNTRGTVVFATAGPNTRTSQIFINTNQKGNGFLDGQGFSPFGEVIEGMEFADQLYSGYGEGAPSGKGPNQGLIQAKGNEYLNAQYPKLSYISKATFAK
jgi:peptidyl-prolyl cis-trans isomerase A (cyclophilin A)